MKTSEIHKFLSKLSEEQIRYIELQLSFARDVKEYQSECALTDKELAEEFRVSVPKIKKIKNGALEIRVSELAQLRALWAEKIVQEKLSLKLNEK